MSVAADKYQAAFDRVRDELNAAKDKAIAFKGPCVKCVHHQTLSDFFGNELCKNPLVSKPYFDDESGEIKSKYHTIKNNCPGRSSHGIPDLCGPNRMLFEAPEPSMVWPVFKAMMAVAVAALLAWIVL